MAQALNSPAYEATKFKRIYPGWLKESYINEYISKKKKKISKVKRGVGLE